MSSPICVSNGLLLFALFCVNFAGAWTSPSTSRIARSFNRPFTSAAVRQSKQVSVLHVMDMNDFFENTSSTDEMVENDNAQEEPTDEELENAMGDWDDRVARFNSVHLTGRIGNDPEPRYFDDGKVVLNLSLASKRKYHSLERKERNIRSGEEETDWYGLEIWGQTAEFAAKYVDKGARVGVIGTLQVDEWTDKETGEVRERVKVVVRDLDILESRAEADLRRSTRRGPSFYTNESGDDDSPSPAGSGDFFD